MSFCRKYLKVVENMLTLELFGHVRLSKSADTTENALEWVKCPGVFYVSWRCLMCFTCQACLTCPVPASPTCLCGSCDSTDQKLSIVLQSNEWI